MSEDSALRPNEPITLANSVAVSQRDGKVYFTSSTDVPPPYIDGVYLPMKSVQLATMLVRTPSGTEMQGKQARSVCVLWSDMVHLRSVFCVALASASGRYAGM